MDVVPIVDALGGVATRQQLIAAGAQGTDLTRAVRSGALRRVRQARYVSSAASVDAIVAARVGGMLAGPSAARSYGLWAGFDTRVHVSVGRNSARLRLRRPRFVGDVVELSSDLTGQPLVVHWLEDGAVPELGPECWRVPVATAAHQVARWCDRETVIACLDTFVTTRGATASDLRSIAESLPSTRARWVAFVRTGSESGVESLARQRLASLGAPIRQQVRIAGVGRVDMLVGRRIVVEVDGARFHGEDRFEADRRRDAELVARGFVPIRLTYDKVVNSWAWCDRVVSEALVRHP